MATYLAGNNPTGIAFDGTNVWVTQSGLNGSILRIQLDGTTVDSLGNAGPYPSSIAFDGTNMWVVHTGPQSVTEIPLTGDSPTTYTGIGSYAMAIAFDGANMWVVNQGDNSVTKIVAKLPGSPTGMIQANGLLGQPTYTTSSLYGGQSSVNALGFGGAGYNNLYQTYISHALDKVNHRLFVSDMGSARILVYQLDATNNIISTTPQYVLGTCDFTTPGSWSPSQNTFGFANTTYDPVNSRLFVSDGFNNRVLAFDVSTSAIHNCENATFVLGQPDFTSHGQNIGQNGLHGPDDTDYDSVNNRLFVSDSGNNRVMVFSVPGNATSSINGENAIFELGKPDFDSNSANDATQNRLGGTNGEAYDPVNSRIFVSDLTHNRVMAFSVPGNATSSINGENAIFELCQPDFFTSSPGRTNQNTCNIPDDLDYDSVNNRLFLGDKNNNRELVFVTPSGATSTINGENAQGLIGQSSWTANTSGLSQSQGNWLDSGHGYDGVNNRFYVDDVYNARVLEFNMIHITTPSFPAGIVGNAYSQSITVTSNQGVEQDYSVYSGNLPDGLSLNSSTGVISGTPTTAGSSTVTIEADDNYQSGSTFFDRKTYDFNINSTDTTPPVTTATPSGGTYGASRDITLACVDDLSGCNHIYYTTDGTTPTTDSSVYSTTPITIVTNTTLKFFSTDIAGNPETPKTETYVIDSTYPVTDITSHPNSTTNSTSATFVFSANKESTFQCKLDTGSYTSCASPETYTSLGEGSHTFIVQATDTLSHTEPSPPSYPWTIDLTPPTRSDASPSGTLAVNTTSTTLQLTTNETATCAYSTTASTAYSSMTPFTATNSTTHTSTISSLQNGTSYTYYVKCQDSYNNTNSDDYSISFSIPSAPVPSVRHSSGGGYLTPRIITTTTTTTTTTTILKLGSKGTDVKTLQKFLNKTLKLKLKVDGDFGKATVAAVKKWQKAHGLVPDGMVGEKTRGKMGIKF